MPEIPKGIKNGQSDLLFHHTETRPGNPKNGVFLAILNNKYIPTYLKLELLVHRQIIVPHQFAGYKYYLRLVISWQFC